MGVKKQFGLLGIEASSPVISENLSTEGKPRDRSICFHIISSDQDLLFVEARSIEPSSRCLPIKLAPQESSCFSPILHNPKGFEQSPKRQSTYDDSCNSGLAITTPVPRSNENVHTTTNFIDLEERSLKKPTGRNSSPCPKQNFKISGMDGLRARLQKEGVSREASNLFIKSRRSSSNSNYGSAWGKWAGWCAERKIDPFCSNINQILEFLSQLFQNGLPYRTINNYSSAISAFHDHIQGKPVGEHPRIFSLVAGVFNSRPQQPRYCFIWNVQTVIDFIKSERGQNEDLSDKYLTYKLTMLLVLTSASRGLGLQHLDTRFMTKGTNNYMFTFEKLHKAWRKGKSPNSSLLIGGRY